MTTKPTTATADLSASLDISGVYLLHFDQPFGHAKHYRGWASNIRSRVGHHRRGTGANLTRVIRDAGIGFTVARIWPNATRTDERRLKNQGGAARMCPICAKERAAANQHQHTEA